MILYSITINIDHQVHEEWLAWIKNEHIPDMLATGLFVENKVLRLLNEFDNGGITYSFQYYLNSMEDYIRYETEHASRLQNEHMKKFRDRFVTFQTLLEVVD
jgi:hypothetical protein